MPHQPLAEVFGFPIDNISEKAVRYRRNRLCPFNNRVANCTKDKANDPLGVCSIFDTADKITITCPVRFRQDWLIAEDAARFFFSEKTNWTSLTEVHLYDTDGLTAGHIDLVLVAYDAYGHILDFGALEVQAVYISGNVRTPFFNFMESPEDYLAATSQPRSRPRPDYLSSSRKRLAPQLLYKGSILHSWHKKQAVAIHRGFYNTLPLLPEVDRDSAELAWFVYDLVLNEQTQTYQLILCKVVYTLFLPSLSQITTPRVGKVDNFVQQLQNLLDEKLEVGADPPSTLTLDDLC
jgi:hypothetical protein